MLRSLAVILTLTTTSAWSAVVGVGVDDGNNGRTSWEESSKTPYSFGALDEDADGKLTNGEITKARQHFATAMKETKSSLVGDIDSDDNGKVSRFESAEAAPRWNSLRERARELAIATNDLNEDGKISSDEDRALEDRLGRVFQKYGAQIVDTNKDKNLSRSEVEAAIVAIGKGNGSMFKLCDLNNDGQLSSREVEMAFALLTAAAGS